jgi:SAM-dependent methyltransferase
MADRPSPYEAPELYDLMFETLDFDLTFWLSVGRGARGPVLDLGCGTGRILLPLLEAGVDADGVDLYKPMLERARKKAAARGFKPRLVAADMSAFTMPRRYARIISAFNAFAHADTPDQQIATLTCAREHLIPGGAFVVHMSYPGPDYWTDPDGQPVMELEVRRKSDGHRFQMWDTRHKDVVGQRQRSEMEIRELDDHGAAVKVSSFRTTQRWVYRYELELLFRLSGFGRWEFYGGFAREPLDRADQQMVAWAWTD